MKRASFFKVVLLLVAFNAALAIFVLLGGETNGTGGKILGSSLLATMGAVVALVCAPAASAGRAGLWPKLGMGTAGVSTAIFIYALWIRTSDDFFKVPGTILVLAVTAALISLLSAWGGSGRLSWVRSAATGLTIAAGAMIVWAIWAEGDLPDGYWRAFGVVLVLLAAAVIASPIVHRMGEQLTPEPYTHCPFDGGAVTGMVGKRTTCPTCGRRYEVAIR